MKKLLGLIALLAVFTLSACSGEEESNTDHAHMHHTNSSEVPASLKEAESPTFPVGSKAIMKTDHMAGMQGAEATIVSAYDTIAYVVSYTPTTDGARVEDHKWIIQEELKDAEDEAIDTGSEVILEADHMDGMKGATAEIVSAEKTTVYMVDYTSSSGEEVKNHKWVTEEELAKK